MRKILIGFVVVTVIAAAVYFRFHRQKAPLETAYAADREVTVWSSTAQVRAPIATANFGDPLGVVSRFGDQVQVRTSAGVVGWVNDRDLLSADFWQKARALDATTASLPVEARGHTRVLSNLHVDAGRDAQRIRQIGKGVPLDLFERRAESIAVSPSNAAQPQNAAGEGPAGKKEDWWLVRASLPGSSAIAGWILGRFIDLDVPAPLSDYASAAGMRVVAWFELNRVSGDAGQMKPQYLVTGARGGEGQPCDFSSLRVFTWGSARQRYETAFVESNVCGRLPVKLTPATVPGGDASFAFKDFSSVAPEERLYKMHQTFVRRVREGGAPPLKKLARRSNRSPSPKPPRRKKAG
jgi:hypothetical protein